MSPSHMLWITEAKQNEFVKIFREIWRTINTGAHTMRLCSIVGSNGVVLPYKRTAPSGIYHTGGNHVVDPVTHLFIFGRTTSRRSVSGARQDCPVSCCCRTASSSRSSPDRRWSTRPPLTARKGEQVFYLSGVHERSGAIRERCMGCGVSTSLQPTSRLLVLAMSN